MSENIVTVRYRATVYVDVDLDAGTLVGSPFVDDESTRLDYYSTMPHRQRPVEVVEAAFDDRGSEIDIDITPAIAARAIEIAETTDWPEWTRS